MRRPYSAFAYVVGELDPLWVETPGARLDTLERGLSHGAEDA